MATSSSSPRRLVRRTDDRVVAGVASGLADLLGVDPVLVRVGFVLLTFAGGAGLVGYLALWLLTPEGTGAAPVDPVRDRGAAFWVAIGLFVLAGLAIADGVAERSVVWPIVLIGVGVALWRSDGAAARRDRPPPVAGTGATGGDPTGPSAPARPATPTTSESTVSTPTPTAPTWTPPPPPGGAATPPGGVSPPGGDHVPAGPPPSGGWSAPARRERSVLGRVTLGVALLAVGVLAILDRADVLTLTFADAVAVALLVLGLGLVVGTWVGRARWLVLPAVLLLLPVLLLSTAGSQLGVALGDGVGERSVGATGVADVEDRYQHGVGQLTVDLGGLDLAGETASTEVRIGIGQLVVVVPDDATVVVDYDVTAGELELFGRSLNGQGLAGREQATGVPGAGTLELDVGVGLGQIELVREGDRPTDVVGRAVRAPVPLGPAA